MGNSESELDGNAGGKRSQRKARRDTGSVLGEEGTEWRAVPGRHGVAKRKRDQRRG